MRIDYSEPRKSYGSSVPGAHMQRKAGKSFLGGLFLVLLAAGLAFVAGFGSGWYFSQQSAKKSFRAAMEQQSLESTSKTPIKSPSEQQQSLQPQQSPVASQTPMQQPSSQSPQQPTQAAPAAAVPLSFFESLPKGQKQTVLGSGLNNNVSDVPASTPVPQHQATKVVPQVQKAPEKISASGGYLIQVAAFATLKEAEAARAKLAPKGYNAVISETKLADRSIWYRVRIGRHLTKDVASEIASRVGGGAKILPDQD